MPVEHTLYDWLSAKNRLAAGMVDPSGQTLTADYHPPWWWGTTAVERASGQAEALPLGDIGDPVSTLASLLSPGALTITRGRIAELAARPPLLRPALPGAALPGWRGQRGNLGQPPIRGQHYLPESAVRDVDGQLRKLFHGTNKTYPDFDLRAMNPDSIYGPGIYLSSSPALAGEYAISQWPQAAKQVVTGVAEDPLAYQTLAQAFKQAPQRFAAPAQIRPVYADLKHLFDIDAALAPGAITDIARQLPPQARQAFKAALGAQGGSPSTGGQVYSILETLMQDDKAAINKMLDAVGFDGIVHRGLATASGQPTTSYIAFSPQNVYPSVAVDALRKGG